jgi:hypothetical protein
VRSKQQITTTFGGRGGAHPSLIQLRRLALLALALGTCLADAKSPAAGFNGLVSIADGDPFTIVRGDTLLSGSKGVTLLAGDIVETGPGAFLAIESQGGNLVGIGPSTGVYFLPRGDVTALLVLKGWVKVDVRSEAMRVAGKRLGIQGHQAVIVLFADEQSDAVFDEQGSARLLLRDDTATRLDKETGANQFFRRGDRTGLDSRLRPSGEFVERMPIAFRDPLPGNAPTRLTKVAPQLVRAVTYSDIQTWLTVPRDWRGGFIERFRGRLKDPAFFAAMDEHLALHPEWTPILHPPSPSEPDRRNGPQSGPTAEQGSEPR